VRYDLDARYFVGLTVDAATFDNPADFFFTSHETLPGVPRYEWAIGPWGVRPFPPWSVIYEYRAHGLLLRDPRIARYLGCAYQQGGW
jgi:hypothetical protein